jgi:hypothetical protein
MPALKGSIDQRNLGQNFSSGPLFRVVIVRHLSLLLGLKESGGDPMQVTGAAGFVLK